MLASHPGPCPRIGPAGWEVVVDIVVCTRFSYFGRSGWQSDFSQDKALLFAPERLTARLATFQSITLPSLVAQTRQAFHHFVLTSDALPDWAMERLQAALRGAYGDESRYTISAKPVAGAKKYLSEFLVRRFGTDIAAQVVLDDDDGLAAVFMEDLAPRLDAIAAAEAEGRLSLPYFVSYPYGYALDMRGDGTAELYRHSYDFINLGLTMVARPQDRNIFAVDHLSAPRRYGVELVERKQMFVRSMHGFNDSRVDVTHRWVREEDWHRQEDILSALPCLRPLAAAQG